jgi:hypothetical protein
MPPKTTYVSNNTLKFIVICVIVIAAGATGLKFYTKEKSEPVVPKSPEAITVPVKSKTVIDYDKLEKDRELQRLMQKRKEEYGVGNGLDMILNSDESVKIGDSTVSTEEISEKIRLIKGDFIEKDIKDGRMASGGEKQKYGIHVVRPGDNIWNIHFRLLNDYFGSRGISLSPLADEADIKGYSSGVAKVLKFSENMDYIYNISKGELEDNLDLIHPLSKIVIYNMNEVFAMLDQIDYDKVSNIHFDGETLWIPAGQ